MTDDRRTSYRCYSRGEEDVAVIRTKRRDVVVRVMEESAGGMAVYTTAPQFFKVGDVLSIAHNASCFEIRVVHMTPIDDRWKIGLERRSELNYLHSAGLFHGITWRGAIARIAIVIAALTAGVYGWRAAPDEWKSLIVGAPPQPEPIVVEQTPEELLAAKYMRLSDARSEMFYKVLKLEPDQKKRIDHAIVQTSQTIAKLYSNRPSENDTEWINTSLDLIQQTWLKIEEVLRPEQQAKFHAMLREAELNSQQSLHASAEPAK